MTPGEGIAFGSLGITVLGLGAGFLNFMYKVSNDEAGKRARIYTRIDERNKELDDKKVDAKLCELVHKQVNENIAEIKAKVACIPDIKAGVDALLKKANHDT